MLVTVDTPDIVVVDSVSKVATYDEGLVGCEVIVIFDTSDVVLGT